MKILLSAIPFDNGKSGISVYIREVVNALERTGHELTLIVEDDGAKEFERFELIRIKKRNALFSMLYSLFILPLRISWRKYDFCISYLYLSQFSVFCHLKKFAVINFFKFRRHQAWEHKCIQQHHNCHHDYQIKYKWFFREN